MKKIIICLIILLIIVLIISMNLFQMQKQKREARLFNVEYEQYKDKEIYGTDVATIINKVIAENSKVVNDYLEGNERSLKFLMGQVMKESHGSVNPKIANDLLIKTLEERK